MNRTQNGRWLALGFLLCGVARVQPASAEPKPAGHKIEPAKAGAPEVKKKLGPAPDRQTSAKVDAYIELSNAESQGVFEERESVLREIDPKVGPTCKESITLPTTIGAEDGRYDAYRKKLKAKPALPADAAALRMVDAVEELHNLGKRPGPHSSYQARGKPADWCKELKEVFPLLLSAFDKFSESSREVRAYVDTFSDERDQREVESTLKKYGKHYRYQFAKLTLGGKLMMRAIRAELAKPAPEVAAVRQQFAAYFAVTDETKAMMDKEPENPKTEPYPNTFSFFLGESVPALRRSSEALLAAIAQKPDKKQKELVDRDWSDVIASYNSIIGYMNQVQFEAKQK
jgi:hypothetical protein